MGRMGLMGRMGWPGGEDGDSEFLALEGSQEAGGKTIFEGAGSTGGLDSRLADVAARAGAGGCTRSGGLFFMPVDPCSADGEGMGAEGAVALGLEAGAEVVHVAATAEEEAGGEVLSGIADGAGEAGAIKLGMEHAPSGVKSAGAFHFLPSSHFHEPCVGDFHGAALAVGIGRMQARGANDWDSFCGDGFLAFASRSWEAGN